MRRPYLSAVPGSIALGLFLCAASAFGQTDEVKQRDQAVAEMLRKFDADLQRNGNGSYEAWVAKLAPLREYWQSLIVKRDQPKLWVGDFMSPDGYAAVCFRSVLGDIALRLDSSEPMYQIVRFQQQLKEKGIDLIFGIIPTNIEVFPEKFADRPEHVPADGIVAPYRRKFLHLLAQAGVEVVDLTEALRKARNRPDADQLALRIDYHWSNLGAALSAQAVAERLKRYDFVQKAEPQRKAYRSEPVLVEGLGQKSVEVFPVTMPNGKLWEPAPDSPILVVGDSDAQVYGTSNPVKHWLPGCPDHAEFAAQISRFTGVQTSMIGIQGFTPDMLNREPISTWKGRKVVVWIADGCHVLADIQFGDVRLKDVTRPEPTQTHLISPSPDTVLGGASGSLVKFTWAAVPGAATYWIDIGTVSGGADIFYGRPDAGETSKSIDLGPYLNGKPIYFQVFSQFDSTVFRPPASYAFKTESVKKN